jgi:hypothetical protein
VELLIRVLISIHRSFNVKMIQLANNTLLVGVVSDIILNKF